MLDTLQAQMGVATTLLLVGFAFLKGDEPERIGGSACALGSLASVLLLDGSRMASPPWALMAVHTAVLVVFGTLASRSRRTWPLWASGLQAVVVMTDLAARTDPRPPLSAFHVVLTLAGWGVLAALTLGVAAAWRERRALGLS